MIRPAYAVVASVAVASCQSAPPLQATTARPALWADTGIAEHDAENEHCPPMSWHLSAMSIGATIGLNGVIWYTDGSGISSARGAATTDGRFDMVVTPVTGNGPRGRVSGRRNPDGSIDVRMNGTGCSHLDMRLPPGATQT